MSNPPTKEQLERVIQQLSGQYDETAETIRYLVKVELKRRDAAGRPAKSSLTRREQNRLSQQRWRLNRKPK